MNNAKTNVPVIPLVINKGETFTHTFGLYYGIERRGEIIKGLPIDLTGTTAEMQIRPTLGSDTIILELTTANDRLSVDGPEGKIHLTIEYIDTESITQIGEAYYSLETTQDSVRKRRFEGPVYFTEECTR